jgi:hypothetical protein
MSEEIQELKRQIDELKSDIVDLQRQIRAVDLRLDNADIPNLGWMD